MATTPQLMKPEKRQVVTQEILRTTGLNAQAFSGAQNLSTLYRRMVDGSASVFSLYRELEEKDTAVASALSTRRALVLSREAKVQSADAANPTAQRFAEETSNFLDRIPNLEFALWELLDAPGYGYAVAEILWRIDDGRIGVEKIVGRPQELFRFGKPFEPQTGELLLALTQAGEGQPVPPGKFLVSIFQPRHGERRGRPLLRRLFWSSWFKRNVLRLHLGFLEKGAGTVVVRYQNSTDDREKGKALEAAQAIAEEIAVAVPEGFSLLSEALQNTRTREARNFSTLADYFDAEMTRVVLGQTLTSRGSEQQHGSRALGEVHLEILFELIRRDATELETVVNEQLIDPWLLWTFGPQALERAFRPWWTIDKMPPPDVARAAENLAKAQSLGLVISESFAREKLEIPAPEGTESVLGREQPGEVEGK